MLAMAVIQALGWCLLHFFWQAALVGAVYALARIVLPRGNPRYLAAMLALVVLAVVPGWTFWQALRELAHPVATGGVMPATAVATVGASTGPHETAGWLAAVGVALPWLVLAWSCGVVLLALRVARQWHRLRMIVRAAEALPAWQARARALARRLGLRRTVPVLASVRIATPTLVGWVRPAVVMPLAMLASMPAEQLDLVLAHELAHLRRLDHLANLFQVLLEIVFFYHPVVHWISRDARNERELCCDALALRASGGSRRDFVAALAGLEEFRAGHANLALAASGGLLLERAWFVSGVAPGRPRRQAQAVVSWVLAAALVLALAVVWWQRTTAVPRVAPVQVRPAFGLAAPTLQAGAMPAPGLLAPIHFLVAERSATMQPEHAALREPVALPRLPLRVVDLAPAAPAVGALPAASDAAGTTAQPEVEHATAAGPAAVAPQALHVVAPVYPRAALARGIRGRVTVAFTLDADGRPQNLAVVAASPAGVFNAAALHAIAQWRFQPAGDAGRRLQQTFSFAPDATGDDMQALPGCQYVTGSHICRHSDDAGPGLMTLPASGH